MAAAASSALGAFGVLSMSCSGDNSGSNDSGAPDVVFDFAPPTCDADLQSDPHHCGSCTNACSTGQTCSGGACKAVCTSPLLQCGDAGCVDISSHAGNCGSCFRACTAP